VVEDPYRWLEDGESPETRAWIDAQNAYTDAVFAQLPDRDEITALMTSLMEIDRSDTPTEEGGRYFFSRRRAEDEQEILYYREGYSGEDRVIIDPHGMSGDHTTSVEFRDISDDGKLVVYAIREGGSDQVSLHLRDIDAGADLPDVLPTEFYGRVELTPDRRGLYYAILGRENPRIYFHVLGTDISQDQEVFGTGYAMEDILAGTLSDNGRWMLMTVQHGFGGWTELHLKDVAADGEWVEVISDGRSRTKGGFAGDKLLLTTNLDADNYRVMTADLARPQVAHWEEFLGEREDVVIGGATGVGGYYFVHYMKDVQPQLAQYDTAGNLVRQIAFETLGSVSDLQGAWDTHEAFVTFSSFHVPTTIYRLDVDTGERAVWFRPEIPIDTDRFQVEQVWYASKDGTRVPMFVVQQRGLELNGDHATLLTGYGGFGLTTPPYFDRTAATWVELGGVYVLANLRGGGEFGEQWHQAGMLGNKQNVFDDFIAAAEYLIAEGYTRPERLAISGGSNGGLLVGAAMTQHPDLFGTVVCWHPLLDMLRYDRFLVAPWWVNEYGTAADPEQFEYLKAYSPYHHVVAGTAYPATLFLSGDADTRVDPLHARKMAALVQAANAGDSPILLRYRTKSGHAGGQPLSEWIAEEADILAFLWWGVGRD
jgi:prolyl oligopeptidase